MGTNVDHEALLWGTVEDIGSLLDGLTDDELEQPSLCDGWRVRDVAGHMLWGHTTRMRSVVAAVARHRGSVGRTSFELAIATANASTPDDLRRRWRDELVVGHARRGAARTVTVRDAFVDHLVHRQDMARPLGRSAPAPDLLRPALGLLRRVHTPVFSTRAAVEGLRLQATDLDWADGDGPVVAGPAEAVLLAAAGRPVALADLRGAGVGVLAGRIGAAGFRAADAA